MRIATKLTLLVLVLWFVLGSSSWAQRPALHLKVSENGRYFVDQKGKPFFWLGTTQWELFHSFSGQEVCYANVASGATLFLRT